MEKVVTVKGEKDRIRREENKAMRKHLYEAVNRAEQYAGDEGLAGYAIVVWDREGHMQSQIRCEYGPITTPLVPTLAHDALNRHAMTLLDFRLRLID